MNLVGGAYQRERLSERGRDWNEPLPLTRGDDEAAVVFTSGSTGPAKGVSYCHTTFCTQVESIRDAYGIEAGTIDLACFPLFALLNTAMGVTTIFPAIDFARPAEADPLRLVVTGNRYGVTQAFASPTIWDKVSRYCEQSGERIGTLQRVFSCGAPVGAEVIARTLQHVTGTGAALHTPYGATESLPVATIEAAEILGETAAMTAAGAGVCVGKQFACAEWKVIRATDEPIASIEEAEVLPTGEIGELIVSGPQVSRHYVTRREANAKSKIADGETIWHRMGDAGYCDPQGRFWYCGRKNHRAETKNGTLYSVPVEGIFLSHPEVWRAALTGCGRPGEQLPVVWIERPPKLGLPEPDESERLVSELRELAQRYELTESITEFKFVRNMPVDLRHNAKIHREELAEQANWVYGMEGAK